MEVIFKNVNKFYNKTKAVSNLNLKIKKGALHFILGPSGCGKTTTLRMLAGLEKVSSGQILFDQQDITNLTPAMRGIGMVFQNYALWPHMTVKENIEYALKIKKLPSTEITKNFKEATEITQLTNLTKRYPSQLSGGQQQRVALARAMAIKPSILLLDEPLSNLDAKLRLEMRENITRIHAETKLTAIYVTHDQKEALSMGTSITVMDNGCEVQTGTPRELYRNPKTKFLASFIGETNFLEGTYCRSNNDRHFFKTELGTLEVKENSNQFSQKQKVTLSFRPESLEVNPNIDTSNKYETNIFTSEIINSSYLGEIEQLNLESLNTEKHFTANVFNPQFQLKTKDKVNCYIKPENIVVLNHI